MAQPTQQLPSWLTLTSTLVTATDGSVSTSIGTLTLPLTYYGPSVPLGTDGVWTYGGLTPPPSTTATPTATPTLTSIPSSPITSAPTVPTASSSASSVPTASTATPPAASHGISVGVLAAILGSILGFLLLIIIFLTLCLIRRNRRRSRNLDGAEPASSSFWNRQTTVFSFRRGESRRQTPIWTGWEFVSPEGAAESGIPRNSGNGNGGTRTPGEGSPRGSGEEVDPFLTRRSIRGGDEMVQTKTGTDTLVSVPAAAIVGTGTPRSSPPKMGHICPPTKLNDLIEQQDELGFAGIRIVEPTPPGQTSNLSPLLPPHTIDPDNVGGLGIRRPRPTSDRSLASQLGRSIRSEKSAGSLETDPAELLVARRVRVDELNRSHTRLATIESEHEASPSRSTLGLSGLGNRLSRLSWFRRITPSASPSQSDTRVGASEDNYTRSPPRSIRHGSNPGSRSRLLDDVDTQDQPMGERERHDSGLGFGLLAPDVRPISTLSTASVSGNTVYHSARSRPASSVVEFPTPVTSPELQRELSRVMAGNNPAFTGSYDMPFAPPPAYEERPLGPSRAERPPSNIDILDMPAPGSMFGSRRISAPPGLETLPNPQSWRESMETDPESPGIAIDIEDAPPSADEHWRDMNAERDHRRTTFGEPLIVHQPGAPNSEYPSVHSLHSHLRPQTSSSPGSSANSSGHSQGGSASSRPSGNSPLRSVASAQSLAASPEEQHSDLGELRTPPLSAVFGSFTAAQAAHAPQATQPPYVTPHSSRAPLLGGTVTSTNTDTNSSVTTALTDPITGAVMHFPALPYRSAAEAATVRRVESWRDDERNERDDHW